MAAKCSVFAGFFVEFFRARHNRRMEYKNLLINQHANYLFGISPKQPIFVTLIFPSNCLYIRLFTATSMSRRFTLFALFGSGKNRLPLIFIAKS
jgi:hypothetical protein